MKHIKYGADPTRMEHGLSVFQGKDIRRTWHKNEWWFSVVDIVAALTDSSVPRRYWSDLKIKLGEEGAESYEKIVQLKLPSTDGKKYETDCTNTEGAFRIIQSIPSPKAEPFKLWLAKTGYERIREIENPELAQQRMKELYRAKGYSDEWIEKRVRGIAIRHELTDEWKTRGVDERREYAILTDEISTATFGKSVEEYKRFKQLKNENLRDHMDDLELIFTMLGERVTTEVTRVKDAEGILECQDAAREGGEVAGNARRDAERRIGKPIVTPENYLDEPERARRKRLPKR